MCFYYVILAKCIKFFGCTLLNFSVILKCFRAVYYYFIMFWNNFRNAEMMKINEIEARLNPLLRSRPFCLTQHSTKGLFNCSRLECFGDKSKGREIRVSFDIALVKHINF